MELRTRLLQRLGRESYDVVIIGGGINGAAAAAALATRGARVALLERGDFAVGTSQQSSNLIWGGIKYLETYEFALVRQLCLSRNRLLAGYPSRVQEIRFLLTVDRNFRYSPFWLWLGSCLYWLLGNGATRPPRLLSRRQLDREVPMVESARSRGGLEYSDAWLPDNDARFVFGFIHTALEHGGCAVNYVESPGARREGDHWRVRARDTIGGHEFSLQAKLLLNAAGPWVDGYNRLTGQQTQYRHVFSKGVHLIVDRLAPPQRILTFFAEDGRLFFAIPMGNRTCIGTTDTPVEDPDAVVTAADRRFILANINQHLRLAKPLIEEDIIAERCGVRPLAVKGRWEGARDWLKLSRQHAVEVNPQDGHISIFGGKLTDCINIGDEVSAWVGRMGVALPAAHRRWYGEPGPALATDYRRQTEALALDSKPVLPAAEPLSQRWWRRYGQGAFELLDAVRRDSHALDIIIAGTDYRRCEIEYAGRREMIVKLEDFLRRRSALAQLYRHQELAYNPGLLEACRILFGTQAREKWAEYFGESNPLPAPIDQE
ncbi:MAG TPA: FAD-dependent oxidoreductase [Candidatus Competibacteraceae bacterium]|nr:FAD-dependent oxidoreductase [Candidatus Competibacteraceae bacterium]